MQDFTYSIFSIVAIAIHLLLNFDMLAGRGFVTVHGSRYRGFLIGILAYYIADGAWGVFAGLGFVVPWYADTIFFFLSLVAFAVMWCRFVVSYLEIGKWTRRMLMLSGYALLAANVALLAANFFNGCVFSFGGHGEYVCGEMRDPLFHLLIAYNVLVSTVVFSKALKSKDAFRGRNMMVFVYSATITLAITLQVIWPLTPFTSLGCLIGNCFFHVFVVRDAHMARHMAELEKALDLARSAEKARSMFFSIVSHDIRTPLNAILGYSELLQHGVASEAEKNEALESIRASGTTLLQLVNDVLDLAKIDAGKMVLSSAPLRLDRLTDEVFSSFRLAAKQKGLKLVNETAGVPTVMLDGHRFRQVLFNLVGNAMKFTKTGSIAVSASYSGETLSVSVTDTGCGIALEMLGHVLDPFFQIHDPSHSAYHDIGTGLGLPICRSLVEAMGGELSIRSEVGKGSTFTARIPGVAVAGGTRSRASATGEARPSPGKLPNRVLVVDDSPVNRSVLTAYLKKSGVASFSHACDGGEALTEIDKAAKAGDPFDFVFTDFWMPNMNGLEFVEKLRADSRFARLPVYAVTADTEAHGDPRSKLFTGVLLKPLTYDKLIDVFAAASV